MRRTRRFHAANILRQVWVHPSNRGRRVRAEARAVAWQIRKRVRPRPVDLPFFGLTIRAYPNSNSASNVVYFTERFDPAEMRVIEAVLGPGDTFADIGANIGTHTLLAATLVGPDGSIVAFEPHPVAATRLRENVTRNHLRQVTVREAAVADAPGSVEFLDRFDVSNSILTPTDHGERTIVVESVTLDEELAGRHVALAKLDLEGFEVAALRGASGRLAAADPPVWLIEVMEWQLAKAGSSTAELVELLAAADFRLHLYDPGTDRLVPTVGADTSVVTGNLWAVADGHADRLNERLRSHAAPR